MRLVAFALIALTWCAPTHAGWLVVGAAYHCDVKGGTFVLIATTESSDDPGNRPDVTAPSHYVVIGNEDTDVRCSLPRAEIRTRMRVWPPGTQGMCHGIGVINFHGLYINGKVEVSNESLFGDGCFDRSVLARIEVTTVEGGPTVITTCYEEEPAGELTCNDRPIVAGAG